MLAKLTSKNQLTLPKQAVAAMGGASHFSIAIDGDRLVLTPAQLGGVEAVQAKLEALGITEQDIADAIAWSRAKQRAKR